MGKWISADNGVLYSYRNHMDANNRPAGGDVFGMGISINWQAGPLGGNPPNGAFVEDVLQAVRNRLDFYQTAAGGQFACSENQFAIDHIDNALHWLRDRTLRRRVAGVEGTHQPHEASDPQSLFGQ